MSPKKVLILGLLILVPIFAFLFLEIFGSNYYELKRYFPVINPDTEEPLVQNGDTVFQQIPDFRLTSQKGESIGLAQLQGKVFVANFIFTSCQGVCKKMSTQMTRVQQAFEKEAQVKLLSFSVDPERDSVAALQQYAARYGANDDQWLFLTGSKPEIYKLAMEGFKLPVMEAPSVVPDFIHSEKFILVDANRHVRGIYDGTSVDDIDRLIIEIKILIEEKPAHDK
jgi:protein SCO1/2